MKGKNKKKGVFGKVGSNVDFKTYNPFKEARVYGAQPGVRTQEHVGIGNRRATMIPVNNEISDEAKCFTPEYYEYEDVTVEESPLFDAIREGDFLKVVKLVTSGEEVNSEDLDGDTVLHEAVKKGSWEMCKYLLDNGADVSKCGELKRTPLHLACSLGDFSIVRLLVDYKSDINALSRFKRNCLHFCCENGNIFIVEFLRNNGVNINQIDSLGRTPLHYAAENGFNKIVQYLLYHEARWNIRDIEEKFAYDIGKEPSTKNLFKRITAFQFSFGQDEAKKISSLRKDLIRYRKMYIKTTKLLNKKELEGYLLRLKRISEEDMYS